MIMPGALVSAGHCFLVMHDYSFLKLRVKFWAASGRQRGALFDRGWPAGMES